MGQTRRRLLKTSIAVAGTLAWGPDASGEQSQTLQSPGGRIQVGVRPSTQGDLGLTIMFDGRVVVEVSRLGFDLGKDGRVADGLRRVRTTRSVIDDEYALVCGKQRSVRDCCNELALDFAPADPATPDRGLRILVRAYDDGVAFRYRLAPQDGGAAIRSELTQFDFPQDYECWGLDLGAFDTAHEGPFDAFRASKIEAHSLFDAPLLCRTGHGDVTFALAEADLAHYAALYFARRDDGRPGVQVRLSPRLDDPEIAVRASPGQELQSPWRVVMVGEHPGRLIESTLITTLSQPSAIADTSWIRPGKAAWDWWSDAMPAGASGPRMSNGTMTWLIDFAAATRLQYLLIDAGWYAFPDPKADRAEADVTRSVPEIDLPGLAEYGRQRGIGIFVWLKWQHLDRQLDEALALYQRIGLKGIKVDYLNRDDQAMIDFYHRLLAGAADRQLMVDLHGATHPAGLARTYPNLMTQEGVMGAEYNKWSSRITSRHNVTLPYTRMLLGPMDYTPGGFRNVTPKQFVARGTLPMVQTTRGQALAMYVVYDSPFACVSDSPDAYKGQAGLDFLAEVPTSWHETRVLSGRIAEFVVIARRHGTTWFVGGMTNERARSLPVRLGFLAPGRFSATIYADGAAPALLAIKHGVPVVTGSVINLVMGPNGGGVIILRLLVN